MKIYIVFEDWAHDGSGEDSKPLKAFKTKGAAITFMQKRWQEFQDNVEDLFQKLDEFEESEMCLEAWKDNDYLMHHEKLEVVECEMEE